jgi:hypothetical protein
MKAVEIAQQPLADLARPPGNGERERAKHNEGEDERAKERHKLRHPCLQRPLERPDDGHGEERKRNRREYRAGEIECGSDQNGGAQREHPANSVVFRHGAPSKLQRRGLLFFLDHNPVSTSVYTWIVMTGLGNASRVYSTCVTQ